MDGFPTDVVLRVTLLTARSVGDVTPYMRTSLRYLQLAPRCTNQPMLPVIEVIIIGSPVFPSSCCFDR
ncbi:hypothetical protein NDU88_001224 [Pleurodeles waltl]|uniref:Uncharacterized protein n=1 Tax=Pleurodeles waltl TaxID=8319 RepID=A0AAV7SZI3_PLEWA|nr:hypothetical protein NDU88_001224 [Pleurodeles waltl]